MKLWIKPDLGEELEMTREKNHHQQQHKTIHNQKTPTKTQPES